MGKPKKTHEQYCKEIFEVYGDEYEILGKYTNNKAKIKVKHNVCGKVYDVQAKSLLMGHGCFDCKQRKQSIRQTKSDKQFKKEIHEMYNGEYTTLSEYKSSKEKVLVKHNICGCEWEIKANDLLNGHGCPICNKVCKFSKGENEILKYLKKRNIDFKAQFKIEGCKDKYLLPFDFAVFENGNLKLLIEYDGKQHFEPLKHFGGKKGFVKRKEHDKIKNNFCFENNIKLLRIPYIEFKNIEKILEKEINKMHANTEVS